jgi:hypothetical protein
MTWRNLLTSGCLIIAFLAFHSGCVSQQKSDGREKRLLEPLVDRSSQIEKAQKPRIIRYRYVRVNFDLFFGTVSDGEKSAVARVLLLNLFDDAMFNVVFDHRSVRSERSFTLLGRVQGIENSQVTLVVEEGVLIGNITIENAFYQIRYARDHTHVVYQIDPATFPPESEPAIVPHVR